MKLSNNTKLLGVLCVTITSICYGLVPSFSFIAFDLGVETGTLLFNKFLYAAIIMWAFIFIRKINFRFPKKTALTMLIACAGYVAMSTTLYIAFDYISGSLATIVSFTFPAMIVTIEMVTGMEPVRFAKILAVILSFAGLVLIVWDPDMKANLIGIFFAFVSATMYVVYIFGLSSKSIKAENSFAVAGYIMLFAAAANFVRCLFSGAPLFATEPAQIGMMILLSVVCVFMAILFYAIGVRLIGPGNAALVNTLEPVLACIFGHFLVGDVLTKVMLVGSAMVVAAVLITNLPDRHPKNAKRG
ncbi:MAG: EamA family transporter [Firmicutes bacterium]|nr:EamA family transporter [Bacillota bacterium]